MSVLNDSGRRTLMPVMLLVLWVATVAAAPQYFRQHGGVAEHDGQPLPDDLEQADCLVWRQPVAPGQSSPCVVGRLVILTSHDADETLTTVALDRDSGEVLWRQVAPNDRLEPFHRIGSPAVSTPATDGARIYVFFGSFGLLCYDLEGNLLWSQPMGPFQDEFGAASSPVLADGKLLMSQDHDVGSFLMAVDPITGRELWKTSRPEATRSYSTPIVIDVAGKRQVVVAGALQMIAYDLNTGAPIWWVNGLARIVNPTPAHAEDLLYVASWTPGGDPSERISMESWSEAQDAHDEDGSGDISRDELPEESPVAIRFYRMDLNQDGQLSEQEWNKYADIFRRAQNSVFALSPTGQGDLTNDAILWRSAKNIPFVPSPLYYRGVLYLVKNGGIATSLDPQTGQTKKRKRLPSQGEYYASPVAGDGKIYLASEEGVVSVLKAGPQWSVLSSHDFEEPIFATPVIADGRVFVRTDAAVYCFADDRTSAQQANSLP